MTDYDIQDANRMMFYPPNGRKLYLYDIPNQGYYLPFLDKTRKTTTFPNTVCKTYGLNKVLQYRYGNKTAFDLGRIEKAENEKLLLKTNTTDKRTLALQSLYEHHHEECRQKYQHFNFFIYNITQTINNRHWKSICSLIDEKWWPYISFIGRMDTIVTDARLLLQSLTSNVDNNNVITAWDKLGSTGWSGKEKVGICNGTLSFLEREETKDVGNNHGHRTDAQTKLHQYYTPQLEHFVENHFHDDLDNPYFSF